MQKFLWFLIVSFFCGMSLVQAVDVTITSEIKENSVFFTYFFDFEEKDGLSSFAFEKPKNSRFISAASTNGESMRPSVAGDFYIFEPEESTRGENLTVYFEAPSVYSTLQSTGTFSTYVTLNFEPESLKFIYKSGPYGSREIFEVYPRDYILLENNNIEWSIDTLNSDQLFLISYNQDASSSDISDNIFLILLLIPVLFFIILLVFLKMTSGKDKDSNQDDKSKVYDDEIDEKSIPKQPEEDKAKKQKKTKEDQIKSQVKEELSFEELFDDFIEKYLTENEQEVAKIIKDNEGIAQNDILDHLPTLTKSNLSKIISKLDGKKILSRIRVGKVNKIYLGDRLKFEENTSVSSNDE